MKIKLVTPSKSTLSAIAFILVSSSILIGITLSLHIFRGIPITYLTRDLAAIAHLPLYAGFLSQIGICCWSATTAVCFLSAKILSEQRENLKNKRFLWNSGIITLILGLDDTFLLHESFFPNVIGIPEKVIYIIYVSLILVYLIKFWKIIVKTDYILLGMAFLFFGFSIIWDITNIQWINQYLLEDSAKLTGIISWATYFSLTAVFVVQNSVFFQNVSLAALPHSNLEEDEDLPDFETNIL